MLTREKAAERVVLSYPFEKRFLFEKDESGNYWDSAHILLTAISKIMVCYLNEAEQFAYNLIHSQFQTIRNEHPISVSKAVGYILDSVEREDRNIFIEDEYWAGVPTVNCAVASLRDKTEDEVRSFTKGAVKYRLKKDPNCTIVPEPKEIEDAEI